MQHFQNGDEIPFLLIQFDLGGHTQYASEVEESASRSSVYESRKKLQSALRLSAKRAQFILHHWAGDGGLFYRPAHSKADADSAYKAMAGMFASFERWRDADPPRASLVCRITATHIPDVLFDIEPGHWYSQKLNEFLKYERLFGLQGTIRITQELRQRLGRYANQFPVPSSKRDVALPGGKYVSVFEDKDHPFQIQASDRTFRHWLNSKGRLLIVHQPTVQLTDLPESAHQIGDSVVLDSSLDMAGYRSIHLIAQPSSRITSDLFSDTEDEKRWLAEYGALVDQQILGTKTRVHSFAAERSDDPVARIRWSQGSYPEAKAFHDTMLSGSGVLRQYLADALRVTHVGTIIPNILSNHSIVVFGDRPNRQLLMCHRRRGERPGTYSRNCWSVSFEEQFNPINDQVGKKEIHQDYTVDGCILRGLQEEIVGTNYNGPIMVATHAFQLESSVLNFGFLGVVELPHLNFDDIVALWPTAIDRDEHDVFCGMALDEELIRACLASPKLPDAIFGRLDRSSTFDDLKPEDHAWHPTSAVRLALALWLSEQDAAAASS